MSLRNINTFILAALLLFAGVLPQIKSYYGLDNTMAGLLQTVFTCSYMLFAPFFGYLGDRCSRKYVIAFGMVIWSMMTLAGSFVQSKVSLTGLFNFFEVIF